MGRHQGVEEDGAMIRTLGKWATGLAIVALVGAGTASSARAQGGRGMFGPGALLRNASVQQELKLSDDQKTKVTEFAEQLGPKYQEKFQGLRDLDAKERTEKMQAVM